MSKYLLFSIPCAISGSILYIACNRIYKNKVGKDYIQPKPLLKVESYNNPGLFIGLGIGCLRAYLGKPIIYKFI